MRFKTVRKRSHIAPKSFFALDELKEEPPVKPNRRMYGVFLQYGLPLQALQFDMCE